MRFHDTPLAGAKLIEPEPVHDHRGFFARTFCVREFAEHGLETQFVQHATSFSREKGTLRGMHFQREPHAEVKVVTALHGSILDIIIDLRADSPTFRRWQAFELTEVNRHRLYIPQGFAHGFQALTENVEVGYLLSEFYEPSAANGVRYDDPAFGIEWPLPVSEISHKDLEWPLFEV
ncbi:MAG: dTDP-4-dehydrorhamnose 3,5-epimerase [Alphaproteobacteria bacterium]